jgi:hypothetical protein
MKYRAFMSLTLILVTAATASSESRNKTPTPELEKFAQKVADETLRQSVTDEAQRKFSTDAGHDYVMKFIKSVGKPITEALQTCGEAEFPSDATDDLVFTVSSEGQIEMLFQNTTDPYGQCIAKHLHLPKIVAKPPGKSWPIQIHLVNGPRPTQGTDQPYATLSLPDKQSAAIGHPPDVPLKSEGQEAIDAFNKAVKPYIAKGRASYPGAKKRFLAGLRKGEKFEVMYRLTEANPPRTESVFVYVDSIKDGVIHGRIASELQVITSHRQWDKISFPESDILDWTIEHADGTEEGNAVGKFIDTYKPK